MATAQQAINQAESDFREEGLGQDANPYNKEQEREAHQAYAWRMHELWAQDFNQTVAEMRAGL